MNIQNKSLIAAIITAAAGLGVAGQASASVYARSHLELSNFDITISPGAGSKVDSFSFDLTNTARLNGVPALNGIAGCGGSLSLNNCGTSPSVLDAPAVNAPGSTVTRTGANLMNYFGPGTEQYANSDSIIRSAQLTDGIASVTSQIAEAELQNGTSGGSSSEIQSQTNFTFTFTTVAPGTLTINWDAALNMLSQSDDPGAITDQADVSYTYVLSQTGGSGAWGWSSDGANNNNCTGNLGCTETDPFDLNGGTAVTGVGSSSFVNSASFSAGTGSLLAAGAWALTLTATTSTAVRRINVPEPSTLLLLGVSMIGLAGMKKRNRIAGA